MAARLCSRPGASLSTALFLALIVPIIALFVGDVLMKPDTISAIGDEAAESAAGHPRRLRSRPAWPPSRWRLFVYSPRRAYSAIGLIAYFLLMEAVPAIIYAVAQSRRLEFGRQARPADAHHFPDPRHDWFFGKALTFRLPATLGPAAYVLALPCQRGRVLGDPALPLSRIAA